MYSGALVKCDGFFSGCSAYLVGRSEADTVGEQASPYPLHRAVVLPSMRGDSGDSARSSLGNHNAPVPHGCLLGGTFCKHCLSYCMNIDITLVTEGDGAGIVSTICSSSANAGCSND